MEQTDGVEINHARNRHKHRLPELRHISVNGHCAETNRLYEYYGCYWHDHACHTFHDVTTMNGDTLGSQIRIDNHDWSR